MLAHQPGSMPSCSYCARMTLNSRRSLGSTWRLYDQVLLRPAPADERFLDRPIAYEPQVVVVDVFDECQHGLEVLVCGRSFTEPELIDDPSILGRRQVARRR
jgi:hypothetical protein